MHSPLPALVDQLNRDQPVFLGGCANVIALLAGGQLAGRLHIAPAVVSLMAEGISDREHLRVRSAFLAQWVNTYGCNESLALGYGCPFGWPHIHNNWLVLDPVDADHRPTQPGQEPFAGGPVPVRRPAARDQGPRPGRQSVVLPAPWRRAGP
ncbi:hypothetical protein [Streptomyces sp. NPDC054794]